MTTTWKNIIWIIGYDENTRNLDIVTDNIAESNILNFSCFYENIAVNYVTATSNFPTVANVINNQTLERLKPNQNPVPPAVTLKITILTNNPINIGESNKLISPDGSSNGINIRLIKIQDKCDDIPPITTSNIDDVTVDITGVFNLKGETDANFTDVVIPGWQDGGSLNQYFIEIPFWNSDHTINLGSTTVGDLLKNQTSYYLYITLDIKDECCNNAKTSNVVVPFLTNSIQVSDTTSPYMSKITTDTDTNNDGEYDNSDVFSLSSNGNIVSFGSEPYTYIFNNTNESVIFQMTVNGKHTCFLYDENNTKDIQTPAVLKSKYTIYWKKKNDDNWLPENTLDYPSTASKIFDITGSVLSFLIEKNELLESLSAGVTAKKIINYIEYDFKIEFEDITGNEYDTFDSLNNEKNDCFVIDNEPVEIDTGTFYAEPATDACQDDVPAWKKYAMVGDTITLTINTNGKINTILNKSNYETNFTYGTNKLQGDTVLTYPTNTNSCIPPYKNDNSTSSTYIISYLLDSNSPLSDGDKIQFNISYKDCSGNEKSYAFDKLPSQGSDFGEITVDTTKPGYSSSVESNNCYSNSKVKSGDKLTLTITPDEFIRTNLATNCKLGVDFYYRIPPLNGQVYLNQDLDTDADGNNQGLITYNTPQTDPPTKALNTNIEAYLTIPQLPTGTLVGPATSEAGKIYYTVTIFDLAGNQGDSSELDSGLTIDNDPPTISSFSCKDAQSSNPFPNTTTNSVTTYYVKGNKKIQFDLTSDEDLLTNPISCDPVPTAVSVSEFKINTTDVSSENLPSFSIIGSDATKWDSTWTVPTTGDGALTMKLKLTDEAGNESGDIDPFNNVDECNIVIDNTKPTFNSYTVTTDGNAHYESDGTTVDTYYAIMGNTITFDFVASEYISEPTVKFFTNNTLIPNGNSGDCKLDENDDPKPGYLCTVNPSCQDLGFPANCDSSINVSNPVATANQGVYYKLWRATYKIDSTWNSTSNDGTLKIEISDFYDIAGNLGDTVSFTTGNSGVNDLATAIIDIDTVKPQLTSFNLVSSGNSYGTPTTQYVNVGKTITFTFNTSEKVEKPTIQLYTTTSGSSNKFDFDPSNISGDNDDCETVYGAKTNGTVPQIKYCDKWTATYTIPNNWDSNYDGNIIIEVSNYEDEHGNIGNTLTFSETSTNNSTKITVPITIDTTPPSAFAITTESTGGSVITSGYYNATNTGIKITIPVADDTSLVGGSIQIQTKNDDADSSYADWGSAISITDSIKNTSYVYTSNNFANAPGYSNDKTISFKVTITDVAGNSTPSNEPTLIVDTTLPTLQAPTTADNDKITSSTYSSGTWDITSGYLNLVENQNAQTLSFQCNDNHLFSTGTSTKLEVWFQNTANNTKYPTGTSSDPFYNNNNLTFSNSNSTATGAVILSLDGGTILPASGANDLNGQSFKLHATVSDKAGNVKEITSNEFEANFTAPKVTSFVVSNNLIIGSTATVTLKFDVDVYDFNSNFDITPVPNATLGQMTFSGGDRKEWTGILTPTSGVEDTSNFLTLKANSYRDKAKNLGPGATSTNYEVDTIRPTVSSFTTTTSSGYYTIGQNIEITANTSENIQNGNSITVTLDTNDTVTLTASSAGTKMTGTYTVRIWSSNSTGLTISSFTVGTVKDTAGNAMTSNTLPDSIFAGKTIVIDTTPPTITKFTTTTTTGTYKIGDQITITAETSENIQSGNNITVTLDTNDTVTLTAGSAGNEMTGTYTVGEGDNSTDLTISSFTVGTVKDTAGNAMTSNTLPTSIFAGKTIVIDGIRPTTKDNTTTALTSNNGDNSSYAIAGKTLSFVVEFTEPVSWTTASNATFSFNIGATQKTAVAISNTTNANNKVTFQYTVVSGDSGVVALPSSPEITMLNGDVIKDAAGNTMTNLALQSLSGSVTVDTTLPTITGTEPVDSNTKECTVTFSEKVFKANGNSLTINNFTTAIVTNYTSNPTNYTPTFTVAEQNTFTSDNKTFKFVITITSAFIFGSEEIVFTPSGVYDEAGNEASSTQTNNRSALTNIKTSPTASSVTIASDNN